jgi:ankyrin repeat protein
MSNIETMMAAIQKNDLDEVKRLFAIDNAIIFEKDREKDTPILKACRECNARECNAQEIVDFLLEKGARIEDLDSIRQTPLIVASQHGCKDIVKKLLAAGANVHHKAEFSRNALITATEEGDVEIVRILLEAGADPKEVNDVDETPQMIALRIHRGKSTNLSKLFEGGTKKKKTKRNTKRKRRRSIKRK